MIKYNDNLKEIMKLLLEGHPINEPMILKKLDLNSKEDLKFIKENKELIDFNRLCSINQTVNILFIKRYKSKLSLFDMIFKIIREIPKTDGNWIHVNDYSNSFSNNDISIFIGCFDFNNDEHCKLFGEIYYSSLDNLFNDSLLREWMLFNLPITENLANYIQIIV